MIDAWQPGAVAAAIFPLYRSMPYYDQPAMYAHCWLKHGPYFHWLVNIDLDEFLTANAVGGTGLDAASRPVAAYFDSLRARTPPAVARVNLPRVTLVRCPKGTRVRRADGTRSASPSSGCAMRCSAATQTPCAAPRTAPACGADWKEAACTRSPPTGRTSLPRLTRTTLTIRLASTPRRGSSLRMRTSRHSTRWPTPGSTCSTTVRLAARLDGRRRISRWNISSTTPSLTHALERCLRTTRAFSVGRGLVAYFLRARCASRSDPRGVQRSRRRLRPRRAFFCVVAAAAGVAPHQPRASSALAFEMLTLEAQ